MGRWEGREREVGRENNDNLWLITFEIDNKNKNHVRPFKLLPRVCLNVFVFLPTQDRVFIIIIIIYFKKWSLIKIDRGRGREKGERCVRGFIDSRWGNTLKFFFFVSAWKTLKKKIWKRAPGKIKIWKNKFFFFS